MTRRERIQYHFRVDERDGRLLTAGISAVSLLSILAWLLALYTAARLLH